MFQDIYIMPDTILNNITSGEEEPDMEKAYKALKDVGLLDFVKSLPEKENTYLVRTSRDNAIDLSGGQSQRLLLTRALYKNGPISILDEPTAALDPISEFEIYTKFDEIVGDKTAIYISHRLSSCRFCDDIVVFHEGEIIQRGSHEELLEETQGKYYELWNAQVQYYVS